MSWRRAAKKNQKYFPTPRKVEASTNAKKSKKKRYRSFSKSSRVATKSRVRPEWYPSNRHDLSSFTAAADLVAQMRYEQLIESRAQRLMREHWAEGFTRKQRKIKKNSLMNHYGKDHPKNSKYVQSDSYDAVKTGFLEPIDPLHLDDDAEIDKLAEEDAINGAQDRFERKVRIDHLKHNFVESRMLRRRLKEIQIEWDEKLRKQREHKEKSKLNIGDKTKRHTQRQSGKFEPYEETKELSKINKWLDRHNESALKEKVESKRLEAIRNREKNAVREEVRRKQAYDRYRVKRKNKIRQGCWIDNPPKYLFSNTFHNQNFHNADDFFVDDVELSGTKVYNSKTVRLIGDPAVKRKVREDQQTKFRLPPISMITPCAVISGGRKVQKPYKWK